MTAPSDSLIHAVLDGEASAAQRAELERRLETDPALRAKFDEMKRVFAMLEAVPAVDPPAGLVDSILARATLRGSRREHSHQPFAGANVIGSYPGDAKAIPPRRSTRGNSFTALVHFLKEMGMNDSKPGFLGTNKGKLLVTAGVAAVALVAISTVIDFPVGGTSTTGTIVPAERHRAPQNTAADINVGLPGGTAVTPGAATGASASDAAGQASRMAQGVAATDAEVRANRMAQGVAATDAEARAGRMALGTASSDVAAKVDARINNNADARTNLRQ